MIPRASIWPNVVFDTTDPDEMAEAQAWLASMAPQSPGANSTQTPDDANRHAGACRCSECQRKDRVLHGPRHGDTWKARNGKATIIATNDWPAPTEEPIPPCGLCGGHGEVATLKQATWHPRPSCRGNDHAPTTEEPTK